MTYSEIIADNLSKAGWSWGCVSAIDSNGRTIWIADASNARSPQPRNRRALHGVFNPSNPRLLRSRSQKTGDGID